MKKISLLMLLLCAFTLQLMAAKPKDDGRRVVIVTIDGLRWQELFGGADAELINSKKYVPNLKTMREAFWRPTREERRQVVFPFTWSYISKQGVMIGDREQGSEMQVQNTMHFSYPGYNELLTGHPDDARVNSNGLKYNPNVNILELANQDERYRGSVLCFGSWEAFPYILNEKRSHLEVNSDYRHSQAPNPTATDKLIDQMQDQTPHPWETECYDVFTFQYAMEAMRSRHPKVVFVGLGETDEYAHSGHYDKYLKSARVADDMIRELWEFCQTDEFYHGRTTFIITCDHGRGLSDRWRDHGQGTPQSEQTWFMAFGADVPAKGLLKGNTFRTQQVAATIAHYLDIDIRKGIPEAAPRFKF